MAIPWLTVLQSVPWGEVVKNAPKVAEGARKLWGTVRRQPAGRAAAPERSTVQPASSAEQAQRVVALEATVADLEAQMVASSDLIKQLAEQNTELIQRIDTMHRRIRWLAVALVILAAALFVLNR